MDTIKITVSYVRSTKRKHVYSDATGNEGDQVMFGALYIPKEFLPTSPPDKVELVLQTAE